MFGLEGQKKKKPTEDFVFDLEKELKDPKKYQELKQKIELRIQAVKQVLRAGESQEDFDNFGLLLHGYTSLLKVIARFQIQKK